MATRQPRIPFFTDNDVADSVGDAILKAGHQLTRLRNNMLTDSADSVVATNCRENGYLLVTHNVKHFRSIIRDISKVRKRDAALLSCIELTCPQPIGARRLTDELPLIVAEWARFLANPDRPVRATIAADFVRLNRDWVR